jgi:hypothetical protein
MTILAMRAPTSLPTFALSLLFENHWAWWIAMLAIAGTLFLIGRLRTNRAFQLSSLCVAVVAIVWITAALIVDTPAERLRAAHRDMANAAGRHDVDKILSYLAPDFSCPNLEIQMDPTLSTARSEIEDRLKQYGIKEIYITNYESAPSDDTAITHLTFLTNIEGFGPVKTSWQLYWKDSPDSDWKIANATLTAVGDEAVSPDHVVR